MDIYLPDMLMNARAARIRASSASTSTLSAEITAAVRCFERDILADTTLQNARHPDKVVAHIKHCLKECHHKLIQRVSSDEDV